MKISKFLERVEELVSNGDSYAISILKKVTKAMFCDEYAIIIVSKKTEQPVVPFSNEKVNITADVFNSKMSVDELSMALIGAVDHMPEETDTDS